MRSARPLVWWQLAFPSDLTLDAAVSFARSLATRQTRGGFTPSDPVVLEVVSSTGSVNWFVGVTDRESSSFVSQLRISIPGLRVTQAARDALVVDKAVELRLTSPARQLRVGDDDVAGQVAAIVLGALAETKREEQLVLQWIVGPTITRRPVPNPSDNPAQPWPANIWQAPRLGGEQTRALRIKQQEPLFGVVARIGVRAATDGRRTNLMRRVFGGLKLLSDSGVRFTRRSLPRNVVAGRLRERTFPRISWLCSLNASELASVVGWPIANPVIAGISYQTSHQYPASESVLVEPKFARLVEELRPDRRHRHRVIGEETYPGREGALVLSPVDALRHLHLIGPTGVGKSTLMANLILQDIEAGRGVVVIEPKRDLIADVLARIPEHRLSDVVVLDPSDPEFVVGLNPLASTRTTNRELVADQLLSVFHGIFRDYWGPRTQDVLHAALLTVAHAPDCDPARSVVAVPLLLTDAALRRRLVPAAAAADPYGLGPFWVWYENLSVEQRAQVIGPVLNKLRQVLLRPALRRTLGSPSSRFSLAQVFTERKVLLVDLNRQALGPEGANLVGALTLSALWQTIQARASIEPARRHPVFVYLDEFQDFTHLPTNLADVLAQSRALGVGLVLAHQNLAQLTPDLRSAVLANAQSRVTFRLSHEDANVIARGTNLRPEDLAGLGAWETYASLMAGGQHTPYASARTLPLGGPIRSADAVRERSRVRYGTPVGDIDEALRTLLPDSQPPPGGTLGSRGRLS